jgi:ABC-type multidrug transport system fused ATPase/permease subunit
MRLQQGAIQIKGSIGAAIPTLALLDELKHVNPVSTKVCFFSDDHSDFNPEIEIKNLDFAFSGSGNFSISNLSLRAKKGQMVALVGPSGAGKTTLIDLILGLHNPLAGDVLISGLTAKEAISQHEGAISYVPQDVSIFEGSIRDNICFGYENDAKPDEWYWNILEQVRLKSFVEQLPDQLNHKVGDRGSRMSGGQRQRLGIARALFTNPKLLILDEATSALDSQTEHEITNTLLELRGKVTLLIIAHRLSTVRSSDLVVYLEMGRVVSSGTFEEVRKSVPEFESQARLLGI